MYPLEIDQQPVGARFIAPLSGFIAPMIIFLGSLIFFVFFQYTPAIIGYITRFPVFAENMLQHGISYFPLINGGAYPDYPIGNTFLIYLVSLPFGKVSIFSMGLPYSVAAALTLVLIYKLGALHDKKWGFYGVLFALFTWQFTDAVHGFALDVYPTFLTVFCFYLVYAVKKWLCLLPLALLAGLLIRGPIGLIVPAAVVFSFYLINKNWHALFVFSMLAGILLIAGMALLLYGAYLQGGVEFVHKVLSAQFIGRIYKANSFKGYFYFTNGLLDYRFTVLFALAVIIKKRREICLPSSQRAKFLLHLTVWFLLIVVALSFVHAKKSRYILSIVPAISLIAAYIFIDPSLYKIREFLLRFCYSLPVIGLIIVLAMIIYNHFAAVPLQGYFLAATLSFIILFIAGILINNYFKQHAQYQLMIFLSAMLTLVVFNFCLYYPIRFYLGLPEESDPVFLSYWPW
jgi:hypothetical protein